MVGIDAHQMETKTTLSVDHASGALVSTYYPSISVSIFQAKVIQDHEIKKGETKSFGFGWCDIFFITVFFSEECQKRL